MQPQPQNSLWIMLFCVLLVFPALSWSDDPKRIVSLDLCTDWMLLKYASPSVQITYSPLLYRYQKDWVANGLPVHNGSLEQILRLDPDLVIAGEFNASLLRKRLIQLGKRVEVLPLPLNLQSIISTTDKFKLLLHTDQALERALNFESFPGNGKRLLLLGANGIGTGRDTLENDVIEKSGWSNYVQQSGFVRLDLEQIIVDPPDAVLWSQPATHSLANLFANHRALKGIINAQSTLSDSWRWQCPGPWTFDLIRELAVWQKY